MNTHQTACYIGVSDSKFAQMRKTGDFPINPLSYGPYWDRRAVDQWLDTQSGLINLDIKAPSSGEEVEDAWIRAAHTWPV
jgi:hypothetical protein